MPDEFVPLFQKRKKKKAFMTSSTAIQFLTTFHWLELCHMATLRGKGGRKIPFFSPP